MRTPISKADSNFPFDPVSCQSCVQKFLSRNLHCLPACICTTHVHASAGDRRLNELGDKLCENLEVFFDDVAGDIKPSVLHGDLWSGNIAGVEGGKPAIFDPATYYGERPECGAE